MGNVYITGRKAIADEQAAAFQVVYAYAGQIKTASIPVHSPDDWEKAGREALCAVMREVKDFLEQSPEKAKALIKEGNERGISFKTEILSSDLHETGNISYRDESIMELRESLAEMLHVPVGRIDVNTLITEEQAEVMLTRAYFPQLDKTYHFNPDDLIICQNKNRTATSFDIYARVVSVDRENDTVVLDRYTGYGIVDYRPVSMPLLETELCQYYRPMTNQEITAFRQGLAALLDDPVKSRRIYEPETTQKTYEAVKAAQKTKSQQWER